MDDDGVEFPHINLSARTSFDFISVFSDSSLLDEKTLKFNIIENYAGNPINSNSGRILCDDAVIDAFIVIPTNFSEAIIGATWWYNSLNASNFDNLDELIETIGLDSVSVDSVWGVLNDGLLEAMNSTFDGNIPTGQSFNLSGLLSEFQSDIPDLLNLRMNILSMDARTDYHEYWDYNLEDSVENEIYVDAINASLEAKVADGDTYQDLDLFLNSYLTNVSDWLSTSDSIPDYIGDNVSGMIDGILPAPTDMFANAPVGEWATGSDNPDVPDFFYKLGMYPDEESGPRYGFPRAFFVPTDFDLTDILGELLSVELFSPSEESPTADISIDSVLSPVMMGADMLLDLILDHYLQELGIIEFEVREKELYVEFDLSNVNGLVTTFLGLNEFGMYLYDQLGELIPFDASPINMFFGLLEDIGISVDIDPTSIDATAILAIRWDENGILDNLHTEASLSATNTTGGEPISLGFEIDISQGEWDSLSHEFTGVPAPGPASVMTESWGVNIGDTIEYTAGYDIDITLPEEIWNIFDEELTKVINETGLLGPGEIVDVEDLLDAVFAEIPNMIHLEVEVVGMDNYATEFEIGNDTVNAAFDVIISEIQAKLPTDSEYGPVEDLISDFLSEGLPNIFDILPATLGTTLTDMIGAIPALPGNIIPPIPTIWMSEFTYSELPEVLGEAIGGGLFIPTDMNYIPVYQAGRTYFDEQLGGNVTFDEFFGQYGVDIRVGPKRLYVGFDFADINAVLKETILLQMTSGDGPDINPSTFTADAVASISWDENGILNNTHLEANVAVDLNSGDPMSISVVFDISQGIHSELGGTFDTTPPAPIEAEFEIPGFSVEILGIAVSLGIAFLIVKIRKSKR